MPNQEELESIIRETSSPSRVDGRDRKKSKVAKLTGRTIGSLRRKINERRMDRAYRKYNENYRKMRRTLKEANEVRLDQEKGENITDSEVVLAYDEVAKYGKKLAKYGAVLLEEDIARVVASQKAKPKPLRVPRVLVGAVRKVLKVRDKRKTKKVQKAMVKDIKATTQDFIRDSLDAAMFKDKDSGELRSQIDATVIQDLGVKKGADSMEDKLSSLRRFISKDGETSLLGEEIAKVEKPTTGVPPVAPTASVPKEEKSMSVEELLGDLKAKKSSSPEVQPEPVKTEPQFTEADLTGDLASKKSAFTMADALDGLKGSAPRAKIEETKTQESATKAPEESKQEEAPIDLTPEEKETINRRQREVDVILSLQSSLSQLEQQAKEVSDPQTRELISRYIRSINSEFEDIIKRGTKDPEVKKEDQTSKDILEPVTVEPKQEEKAPDQTMEAPISTVKDEKETVDDRPKIGGVPVSAPQSDGFRRTPSGVLVNNSVPTDPLNKVRVKENESMRAEQVSRPSALRVTPQDIKNMEDRNKSAEARLTDLAKEKQELEEQKKMLQDYISVAKATRDNEMRAQEMARSNAALASEVAELNSQRAAIDADLGRTR